MSQDNTWIHDGGQPPDWPLAPVRADSLRQQAFDIIRNAVFAGKIQPGQPLREQQLARNMGVSQSTIREALSQLEHVGLVVRRPNRTTTVTSLTVKEMRDRLRIRLALEELAISEAAAAVTEADLADLESIARSIADAIAADAYYELGQEDLKFHRRIWQIADNPVLFSTLDAITTPLFAFLGVLEKRTSVNPRNTQPHEKLIEALRTREPDVARRAISGHILSSYESIINSREEVAERPLRIQQV